MFICSPQDLKHGRRLSMEEMIKLLNQESLTEEDGTTICKKMGSAYNCFGSYPKKSVEIYESLTPEGKRNFILAVCISAFELAYSYNPDAIWIDDRKKASQIFAQNNIDWFNEKFKKLTGFMPSVKDNEDGRYYPGDINYMEFKNNGCEWLIGYLSAWVTEHSTIKQSFFGGVVNGILVNKYLDELKPNSDYGISFPFI